MKWIGLLLVFGGCTAYGFLMDRKKRLSLKEVEHFIFIFELLRAEIDYGLTPIGEACMNVAESALPEIGEIFRVFAKKVSERETTDIEQLWRESLDLNWENLHLENDVYSILEQFGAAVGYLDKQLQKKNIDIVLSKLTHLKEKIQEQFDRTSRLNTTLGMLVGVCAVILLI